MEVDDIIRHLRRHKEDIKESRWEAVYRDLPMHIFPTELSSLFLEVYPPFISEIWIIGACYFDKAHIPGETLTLNASIIEYGAFANSILPKNLVLNQLTCLGVEAFTDAKGLEEVVINSPYSMSWSTRCFSFSSLKAIYLGGCDLGQISRGTFEDCFSLQIVELPENTYDIQAMAFKNCAKLKSLHLPSNLHKVGLNAFKNCRVESITIDIPSEEFYKIEGIENLREGCAPGVTIQCSDKLIDNWK